MIRLADLRHTAVRTWADSRDSRTLPPRVGAALPYNIAADCLAGRDEDVVLVTYDESGSVQAVLDGAADVRRQVTRGELREAAARFATMLHARGVRRGDRVAVRLAQGLDLATVVLGTLQAGAVVVTISEVLGDAAMEHRIEDSGAALVICGRDQRERTAAAAGGATVLAAGDGWLDGYEPRASFASTTSDDPALLLYTSGTTGNSKGALHAHRVLLGHHALDLAWDRVQDGDVAYSPVDWTWGGGMFLGLLAPLAYGMTLVAHRGRHFDPQVIAAVLRAAGVTVGFFPPTALRALHCAGVLTAGADLRLRALITGAEAVEPELIAWARESVGVSINNAFGQTEANALIGHAHVLGDLDAAALGRAYPGRRIVVLDDRHQPVAPGEMGEIAVAADDPVCMIGYWNNAAATEAKLADGWLLTNDIGHMDADGVLYFHGRDDDVIKSGGYRIGPAEIEAALFSHPAVDRCAAVGLPDRARGQQVVAYVQLTAGFHADDELTRELQARVRKQVGAHAYPRRVEYVDALAVTSTGKVNRRALRDAAIGAQP